MKYEKARTEIKKDLYKKQNDLKQKESQKKDSED